MTASMMWLHDHVIPLYWSSQHHDGVVVSDQPVATNRYFTLMNDWYVSIRVCVHAHVCICLCVSVCRACVCV